MQKRSVIYRGFSGVLFEISTVVVTVFLLAVGVDSLQSYTRSNNRNFQNHP